MRTLIRTIVLALALLLPLQAGAAEPTYVKESKQVLDRAKEAYNAEDYEKAAQLFILAAQIDPGAQTADGATYRNLARCLFWLGNYDKAVFWYNQYIANFPEAADRDAVKDERKAANDRRTNPDRKVTEADIYDRSLLELIETLELRLGGDAPAYTADGGGTTRLYRRAIELGYATPKLATWSAKIRAKLLAEMDARWTPTKGAPLPNIGPDAEDLDVSRGRLANLRSLAPRSKEMDKVIAWQRFVDAWGDYFNEKYPEAAGAFLDAAGAMPDIGYLTYATALAHLRAGDADAAIASLKSSTPGAPRELQPYYELLRAEALLVLGRDEDAAAVYMKVGKP